MTYWCLFVCFMSDEQEILLTKRFIIYVIVTENTENNSVKEQYCSQLREKRSENELEYCELTEWVRSELSEMLDKDVDDVNFSIRDTLRHIKGECECEHSISPVEDDQPWREKAVMRHLFIDQRMYFTEMSDLLGCHDETARNWVGEHNLSPKDTHHTSSKLVRHLQHMDVDPYESVDSDLDEISDS